MPWRWRVGADLIVLCPTATIACRVSGQDQSEDTGAPILGV